MRRFLAFTSCISMVLSVFGASAQTQTIYELPSSDPAFTAYAAPQSIIQVVVTIEKTSIRTGPYARYAQKLLGVTAPLTDKDTYRLSKATLVCQNPSSSKSMMLGEPRRLNNESLRRISLTQSDTSFMKFTPDRSSLLGKSPEDMARDAANTILRLRKQRLDMISGDAGENVFGAGLQTALKEMDRLENEYLALFMGKQWETEETQTCSVVPNIGKLNYVVARFSNSTGLMTESDLSGSPILLVLKPEATPVQPAKIKRSKDVKYTAYRLSEMVNCRILIGSDEIARAILPLYQFGITIEAAK